MKKLTFLLILLASITLQAQKRDPQFDKMNFEPGQLIVKLKDNVDAGIIYSSNKNNLNQGFRVSSNIVVKDVPTLLGLKAKVKNLNVLFSKETVEKSLLLKEQKLNTIRSLKNSTNQSMKVPTPLNLMGVDEKDVKSLKNILQVEFDDKSINIHEQIELLKANADVEYVEPNYLYSVNDFEFASDPIYPNDLQKSASADSSGIGLVPNDPLYSEQYGIPTTKIDQVWKKYTTGDGKQVVAILDTGVDYEHPDLAANIWTNTAELNGIIGYDDDGNGFVDDIRGWDFINYDNSPKDDNMHGTHVAGIVGAVGNNGIGIAGAVWNVKLMPIKVFQSNGTGNATTIAAGINYATQNGATVQNMSFGSYAESMTLKTALENAYSSSVLVAAAGNDKICIGPGKCPDNTPSAPLFPGAYTFVLGVEDSYGNYDNYDQDGPTFSGYSNLLNYELQAPGNGIMSTVPNGGYRKLTGTSMATPMVAGAVALYLEEKPKDSKELLFGNYINTSNSSVDALAAIEIKPTPILKVIGAKISDKVGSQNGNGYFEPGETLEIFPKIKNYWGPTDSVYVGIEFWEFEDTSKAQILEKEIYIGSISAYADLQILSKTLKLKLDENIANNVNIQFKLCVWSGINKEYLASNKIIVNVKNAIILTDYISEDFTLQNDKEYIMEKNLIISNGAKLTIEPGAKINLGNGCMIIVDSNSSLEANGTAENPITITCSNGFWKGIQIESNINNPIDRNKTVDELLVLDNLQRVKFNYTQFYNMGTYEQNYQFYFGGPAIYQNCLIKDCYFGWNFFAYGCVFDRCTFDEFTYVTKMINNDLNGKNFAVSKSNFTNFNYKGDTRNISVGYDGLFHVNQANLEEYWQGPFNRTNFFDIETNPVNLGATKNGTGIYPFFSQIWFGTDNLKTLDKLFYSFSNSDIYYGKIDFTTRKIGIFEDSHGVVWKVLVDGKDAQDEYDQMDPIGVGDHQFDVYFNRQMDTTMIPQISYGVREPYNQKIISEKGVWSEDGKIYKVKHKVNIGAADGINRIRVQNARDTDYFEIPVEATRFNMIVQSAGSASSGFYSTPGLGEIALEWEKPSEDALTDILGYNMYRYESITDSTFTEPVKINSSLITDTIYKDYNVVRNKNYFYKYKILRTSFDETDYSKTVTGQLLTAKLGDSNGDFSVNVMDIVNTVNYIIGNNPTPFVDYATDVNNDSRINVLDVVGIVSMILNPSTSSTRVNGDPINYVSNTPVGESKFYWLDGSLYVQNQKPILGLQLAFDKSIEYTVSDELNNFELLNFQLDNSKVLMAYSFINNELPAGTHRILTIKPDSKTSDIISGAVATTNGESLKVVFGNQTATDINAPIQHNQLSIINLSPNPSRGNVKLNYYLPEMMDKVNAIVYDLSGKVVWHSDNLKNVEGFTETQLNMESLSSGVYVFLLNATRSNEVKFYQTAKIVIE